MYVKCKCHKCGEVVNIFSDDDDFPKDLKFGEHIEYKCPKCELWSALEVII